MRVPGSPRPAGVPSADAGLRQLYDAHAAVLLAYAVRLTDGDRARAEDLVQETLLRAWRKLEDLDDATRPIRPWLFTVVQRLAIDAHRARRARPQEVGDAMLAAIPELDEVEHTLDRIVVTEALRVAVAGPPGGARGDLLPRAQRGGGRDRARCAARHGEVAVLLRAARPGSGPGRAGSDAMTCANVAVGAYALGALDPAERADVERHLRECPSCAAEAAEFAALPPLLALVPPEDLDAEPIEPSPGLFERMAAVAAAEKRAAQRRSTRGRLLIAAVAAAVLAIGGTHRLVDDVRPVGDGAHGRRGDGAPDRHGRCVVRRHRSRRRRRGGRARGELPARRRRPGRRAAPGRQLDGVLRGAGDVPRLDDGVAGRRP